jgi:N-acetylmuramoyl-L-alanine amidase
MSTEIKNGKHHANIIHNHFFIILFLLVIFISASASTLDKDKVWVIVIDAGHGGRDPGALGAKSREKDITLAIALKTGEYLEKNTNNVKVIYTRKDDSTVDLRERPKIANKNNADLFISIHANWAKQKYVMGAETFIMGHTKNQANLEVAMKENEVIYLEDDYSTKYEGFDPKSQESYIEFSLMQNIFQKQSTDLADKIQTQFRERVSRNDRDVKQAGFWVLFTTSMPSVLIETGFITNAEEEKFLTSKQGQDYLASAIFRACRDYINEIDQRSGISIIMDQKIDRKSVSSTATNKIVFMVQIANSSTKTEINNENFKGLNNVVELKVHSRFKYASGSFSNYPKAAEYRKKLELDYPGAFIIAVKDNKLLPLQEAIELTKNK